MSRVLPMMAASLGVLLGGAAARAQEEAPPAAPEQPGGDAAPAPAEPEDGAQPAPAGTASPGTTTAPPAERPLRFGLPPPRRAPPNAARSAPPPDPARPAPPPAPAPAPRTPPPPLKAPTLFTTPTGRLLPAGLLQFGLGLDTGAGSNLPQKGWPFAFSALASIGLGDVAEFGVDVTDLMRALLPESIEPERQFPYLTARFKMGLEEGRLARWQPAVALLYRKSFEHDQDARKSRIADFSLVASKGLGRRASVHLGVVFWDASVASGDRLVQLHSAGVGDRLRPFGGVELEPLARSRIVLDLGWMPEFDYRATPEKVALKPIFSWGVRYELADWAQLEAGVRIPNMSDVNLLEAQIFGQLRLVARWFAREPAAAGPEE